MGDGSVSRATQFRWLAGIGGVAAAVVVGLVASADGPNGRSHDPLTPKERLAKSGLEYRHDPDCPGAPFGLSHPYPAEMIFDPEPIGGGSDAVLPIVNGWSVYGRRQLISVRAGRDALDESGEGGRISVYREDFCHPNRTDSTSIAIPNAGAVKITRAPTGPDVIAAEMARSGRLRFSGRHGLSGTLYLGDRTISLDGS